MFLQATRVALLTAVLITGLLLPGCGVLEKVSYPEGDPRNRNYAQHRMEYELIPNAELSKESTTPDWPLGRHVFRRGPDRLMVLTRITSFPVNRKKLSLGYRDARVERVWINIPLDVPVGQQFTLEESFTDFHVGYDRAENDLKKFYIRAIKPKGTVQVMAWRANEIDVKLDIRVRPESDLEWHITDVITVPIYPNGNWAREYVDPNFRVDEQVMVDASSETNEDAATQTPRDTDGGQGRVLATGGDNNAPKIEPDKVPADNGQGAEVANVGDGKEKVAAPAMSLAGMWINDEPAAPFELRFQFDDKGTFIMGSTRGGGNYAPGMKYGSYELRGNDLIMSVTKYEFDGRDHMMYSKNHTIIIKAYMSEGDLILDGDLGGREGKRTVRLKATTFPDMNFVLPPRGRSGKYQF